MQSISFANLTTQKKLLLAGWGVALIAILFFIFHEGDEGGKKGKGLAIVAELNGQVQVREADQLLWKPTSREAPLFLNDYIATGEDAASKIVFGSGRVIQLSSNTQIRITAENGRGEDGNFTIDLLKGQIKALPTSQKLAAMARAKKVLVTKPVAINIRASGQTFKLQSAKAVLELKKPTEAAPVKVVSATKGIEAVKDGKKTEVKPVIAAPEDLEPATDSVPKVAEKPAPKPEVPAPPAPKVEEPKPQPAPVETKKAEVPKPIEPKKVARKEIPKPKPRPTMALAAKTAPPKDPEPAKKPEPPAPKVAAVSPNDYLPSVASASNGAIFWTADTLEAAMTKGRLPVTVRAPTQKPDNASWTPVINPNPRQEQLAALGKDQFADQDITLDLAKAKSGGSVRMGGGAIPEAQVSFAPGALLTRDGKALAPVAYGESASVKIRSLKGVGSNVILDLGGLKYQEEGSPFVKQSPPSGAPVTSLYLASSPSYGPLFPFLQGARGFQVRPGTLSLRGQGTFIVKNQQVIGALSGAMGDPQELDILRRKVGADYIFSGDTASLIGDSSVMMRKLEANEMPEKFFVFHKGSFIGINANFIRTNKDAKQFILNKSASFFNQPIKILAPLD